MASDKHLKVFVSLDTCPHGSKYEDSYFQGHCIMLPGVSLLIFKSLDVINCFETRKLFRQGRTAAKAVGYHAQFQDSTILFIKSRYMDWMVRKAIVFELH